MDPDLAALACKILCLNLFIIQIISDLLGDRRLLGRGSLIKDIVSVRFPDDLITLLFKSFVTLDVLDIGQRGLILDRALLLRVLEPVGNCDITLLSVGIRKNINSLFLGRAGRYLADRIRHRLLQSLVRRLIGITVFHHRALR